MPGYTPCNQTAKHCIFYYKGTAKASCSDMCALGKGTCYKLEGNQDDKCTPTGKTFPCKDKFNDGICWCTR